MSHELIYFIGHDEKPDWPESVKVHLPIMRKDGVVIDKSDCPEGALFSLQAASLYELAIRVFQHNPATRNIIEIGRRNGFSTRILLDACLKTKAQLFSIDKREHDISSTLKPESLPLFHQLVGDGTKYEFPVKAQLVFVDTFHDYDGTLAEMEHAWKFVEDPGIMIVYKSESHFGCKKAVWEWAQKNTSGGFIHDSRGQGMSIFIKPNYPPSLRDRNKPDYFKNDCHPTL